MKTQTTLLAALLGVTTSWCSGATITENFDSYPNGTTAAAAGWSAGFGTGLADWAVKAPPTTGDPSAASFARGATYGDGMIYKSFGTANPFSSLDTVYYSAWVRPQFTGTITHRMSFGITPTAAPTSFKELCGVSETDATSTTFKFFVANSTTTVSTSSFATADWYVLQLVIDQSAGSTNATGSLYARDVTTGQTSFTAVAGLQNISLGLTSSTEVADWENWALRSSYRGEVDNLYLSTSPVPEPSEVTLLALGGVLAFFGCKARRSQTA